MPDKIFYALASGGTVLSGITYKLRSNIALKACEWIVLSLSLALFGAIAFAMLGFYFPLGANQEVRLGLSILLGVGMSETWSFIITAAQRIFDFLPDEVREAIRIRSRKG